VDLGGDMKATIELPEGKEGFGERLRFLLYKNHTNVSRLADQLGLSRYAVYMYTKNETRPKLETCIKICKILGCSIEFLVLGKEEE
jgi:transcriptional regulator with XRE-family HTH domain